MGTWHGHIDLHPEVHKLHLPTNAILPESGMTSQMHVAGVLQSSGTCLSTTQHQLHVLVHLAFMFHLPMQDSVSISTPVQNEYICSGQ